MNTDFRYKLTKRGKAVCPQCERKTFVLYIDSATGEPLHSTVGKCDRSDNCGHHYTPKQYFIDNGMNERRYIPISTQRPKIQPSKPISFIDRDIFKKSLAGYDNNVLIKHLAGVVGTEKVMSAVDAYHIGTTKGGGTIFWQIDNQNKVRTGKIIQYAMNGRRRKDAVPPVRWVHTTLKINDFSLIQCLFGEHLLRDSTKMVAIVESEKTAIIASVYLPNYIWLATGGKQNFSLIERCAELKAKKVVLFPDLKAFEDWRARADELKKKLKFDISVSDLLEKSATEQERAAGLDIADYLLKQAPSTAAASTVSEVVKHETDPTGKQYQAYVSDARRLYIPTPPDGRITYTVYPDVEAYNQRSTLPKIIPMQSVDISEMKQVFINLNTLTINDENNEKTTEKQ